MDGSLVALAIKANMPMIAVTTDDRLNLEAVLKHITGREVEKTITPGAGKMPNGSLFVGPDNLPMPAAMYGDMVKNECVYVAVNLKKVPTHFFDAGEVPVPKDMLEQLLLSGLKSKKIVDSVMPVLGGLTIARAVEVVRLTMSRDGSLTSSGIAKTRRDITRDARGVTLIDTKDDAYMPPSELAGYMKAEKDYFLTGTDPRLMPRGLLFDGPPGTGKTAAAKHIAHEFGIPLYRVDFGTVQEKWVGSSEEHMTRALSQLDAAEPCVALFDEIEKMVSGSDSTGIGGKMMAQVLWWMQERDSRVFVVMTTNKIKNIPPELFRPGRIDDVMVFNGLKSAAEVNAFIGHVLKQFPADLQMPVKDVKYSKPASQLFATQADVTVAVYKAIKMKAAANKN